METLCHHITLNRSWDYSGYKNLMEGCVANKTTTGEITPQRIDFTVLNLHRMNRVEKLLVIRPELEAAIRNIRRRSRWVVLSESWCGDSAQNLPVIAALAALNPNIELTIGLRDENPELMNAYLTAGARSVPKLICVDCATGEVTGTWGPRPERIARQAAEFKRLNPDISHDEFVKNLHVWYGRDRSNAIQEDFLTNPFYKFNS